MYSIKAQYCTTDTVLSSTYLTPSWVPTTSLELYTMTLVLYSEGGIPAYLGRKVAMEKDMMCIELCHHCERSLADGACDAATMSIMIPHS